MSFDGGCPLPGLASASALVIQRRGQSQEESLSHVYPSFKTVLPCSFSSRCSVVGLHAAIRLFWVCSEQEAKRAGPGCELMSFGIGQLKPMERSQRRT